MTHRTDLIKQRYKSRGYGKKKELQKKAKDLKSKGIIKSYRVVPDEKIYELYAK